MLHKTIIKLSLHIGAMEGLEDTGTYVLHARHRHTCGQLHIPAAFMLRSNPQVLNKEELILKQEAQHFALILCCSCFSLLQ